MSLGNFSVGWFSVIVVAIVGFVRGFGVSDLYLIFVLV